MSMISHLSFTGSLPPKTEFLYSVKEGTDILFYDRLQEIVSKDPERVNVKLFVTGRNVGTLENARNGRITQNDLLQALGAEDRDVLKATVIFVCGPPRMTDEMVAFARKQGARVYCEKWW